MPGPPPSENPVRRNARVGPVRLPASGRKGETPAWPLDERPDRTGERLWADLWRTPQSIMWERLGWVRIAARYVQLVLMAERAAKPEAAVLSHVLALEDRLGLTPKAMRNLLWEIAVDEVGERRDERDDRAASSARGRLKAVG